MNDVSLEKFLTELMEAKFAAVHARIDAFEKAVLVQSTERAGHVARIWAVWMAVLVGLAAVLTPIVLHYMK